MEKNGCRERKFDYTQNSNNNSKKYLIILKKSVSYRKYATGDRALYNIYRFFSYDNHIFLMVSRIKCSCACVVIIIHYRFFHVYGKVFDILLLELVVVVDLSQYLLQVTEYFI